MYSIFNAQIIFYDMKKKLVVLTGAGISAESGIKTFRDSNGLWEAHDVNSVATPEGFNINPALVLEFYNQRRRELQKVQPNLGHRILVELEDDFDVTIITQNVDNLHERAVSSKVIHLHGELTKVQSTKNPHYVIDWTSDLNIGDFDDNGNQLRPNIVWFGEDVPAMDYAISLTEQADYLIVIGTSLQVYPAAGLIHHTQPNCPVFYIDPKPASLYNLKNPLQVIAKNTKEGLPILRDKLILLNEN